MSRRDFYVQLHMHTAESSRCGVSTGAEMARAAKEAGYDMIVVTDHFMNANINCSPKDPWEKKVEILFRGYYSAKEEGDRIGLLVLPAWETMTRGPEILTYGLDEAFLLANPDIADVPLPEYVARVKRAGGWVFHAHPYRWAPYITEFVPDYTGLDGIEVYNAAHHLNGHPEYDVPAEEQAEKLAMPRIAGSDAHDISRMAP